MENESTEEVLKSSVLRILEHADLNLITESKVRKLVAEDTGLDLKLTAHRKVVKKVIEDFFVERQGDSGDEGGSAQDEEGLDEAGVSKSSAGRGTVTKEESEDESPSSKPSSGKSNAEVKKPEKGNGRKRSSSSDLHDDDQDGDKEVSSPESKKKGRPKSKRNDNGDIVVCALSAKRNVTVQKYQGAVLVAIREYYEKDGKQFPTQKGISLTVDQWESLKEGVPAIHAAIKRLQKD